MTRSDADAAVVALALCQQGAFARWQLTVDDGFIRRRVRAGRWRRVRPGVFVLAGVPGSPAQDMWIAYLAVGSGAVMSHEAAGERWGYEAIVRGLLTFTVPHGWHHRIAGVVVHQLDDVLPQHRTEKDGFAITTPSRTVVDLATVVSTIRLKRIVEQGIADRIVAEAAIAVALREVARVGKPGVRKLARVLAARAPGDPIPDSALERMLLAAVLDGGNPRPIAQFPHPGRNPTRGCVDFAYPDVRLILEADGRRWHQRIADLGRDRQRDNEAARVGWLTLRFMYEELANDPGDVGLAVKDVRRSRQSPVAS